MSQKIEKCDKCGAERYDYDSYCCDVCKKEMHKPFIQVKQHCYCWENDSVDGEGIAHFCSWQCFLKIKDFDRIGNACCNSINGNEYDWAFTLRMGPKALSTILLKEAGEK